MVLAVSVVDLVLVAKPVSLVRHQVQVAARAGPLMASAL
jgi:hypothetical protein